MTDVPPIHLINLDRSTDRLRRFQELNGHIKRVSRFSGIDGASLDRKALVASGYITEDLCYGDGTLGCALSHVRLWEMAISYGRSLTIFEDDVALSHHFDEGARKVIAGLPADWDLIQWGCILSPLFAWVDLGVTKTRLHTYGGRRYAGVAGVRDFQAQRFTPSAVRLLHSFGAHCYSISPRGARSALDFCLPLRNRWIEFPDAEVRTADEGIDITMCGLYPTVNAFLCLPNLALPGFGEKSVQKLTDAVAEQQAVGENGIVFGTDG